MAHTESHLEKSVCPGNSHVHPRAVIGEEVAAPMDERPALKIVPVNTEL
jgi:hypothetical protein